VKPVHRNCRFFGVYHPGIVRLVLASASPRRRDLLAAAGFPFDVDAADVDETRRSDEPATTYVVRVARDKAAFVAARHPERPVLAADTAVVMGDAVLGKPADRADAARMIELLSGRAHQVVTGLALAHRGQMFAEVEQTAVWLSKLSSDEISWYVASGEPMDKAGAYAIQGLASRFIPRIEGSYSNVVGLPVATLMRILRRAGLS
jgi:septum formation protein